MRYIIIQARMTSTRLPQKVLLPLCDRSVLAMMLQRLERFREQIIIATTDDGSEAPIVALCEQLKIRYYRGDTQHVLSRYYEAAVHFGATSGDTIVRLTSDCPLMDPDIVQRCMEHRDATGADYCSNVFPRTFPQGLDCEVFTFDALQRAFEQAQTSMEQEHVTPYIHTTHKAEFTHASVTADHDDSVFRITLDETADYEMITVLYEVLGCRTDFDYPTLIDALYAHPDITALNARVQQKSL